ncbi:MAG: translocation/assembly module TamB domain-containing protein, partial [Prevotella sp.]|nr:translocation/assembly module TamB domain-containing protein [Prevotella sp.]
GTYGVTIQNIIRKNFTFNRGGTIVFGGDPYNAALNLQALYTVNGVSLSDLNIGNSFASNTIRVNCLMNIGGQPVAPQVDFDLEMPTVNADEQQMIRSIINGQQEMNQQVLYLLGIGRFYNQGQNNAGTEQTDQTTLAMQSFLSGTLSTQINSLLSTVIKNDNWNFGANISTGNEGWHNAEYEGIISGRMLNNRLLLNGQFGYRDNATQANPSFIGDFDLQYLLYPNGNLALKVYNQTNDRYFTKSSLNTQGIGLIMKKDFNGLRDLFSRKEKRRQEKKNK